jgi:hypothetical protein
MVTGCSKNDAPAEGTAGTMLVTQPAAEQGAVAAPAVAARHDWDASAQSAAMEAAKSYAPADATGAKIVSEANEGPITLNERKNKP